MGDGRSELAALREAGLLRLLRWIGVVAAPLVGLLIVRLVIQGRYGELLIVVVSYGLFPVLALAPLPYAVRSRAYVGLMILSGASLLLIQGFSPFPMMVGAIACVTAVLFLGFREAVALLGGWSLVIGAVGFGMDFGWYMPPADVGGRYGNRGLVQPLVNFLVTLPALYATHFLMGRLQDAIGTARRAVTELQGAQERLIQGERLRTLGLLAGGVAHDLNNTLTVIVGEAELMEGNDEAREAIVEAAGAASHLTAQLLGVAGKSVVRPTPVDLQQALGPTLKAIRKLLPEGSHFEVEDHEGDLPVYLDVAALHHVVLNLAVNARDAMGEGGHLTIRIGRQESAAAAILEVIDDGVGMSPEVLARATEALFTTKPPGQGTGLGLANVARSVQYAGGTLEITSTPGAGTRVRVSYPLVAPNDDEAVASSRAPPASWRCLAVESDDRIRSLVVSALASAGHVVEGVASIEAARSQLAVGPPPDIVVSDLALRDGSGVDAASLAAGAGAAFVLLTGQTLLAPELGDAVVVRKPFTVRALRAAVHDAVTRRRARDAAG